MSGDQTPDHIRGSMTQDEWDQCVAIAQAFLMRLPIPCAVTNRNTGKRSIAFMVLHPADKANPNRDGMRVAVPLLVVPPDEMADYEIDGITDSSRN